MYWWRIEPVKREFAAGGPPETDKLKYFVLTLTLYVVLGELGYLVAESDAEARLTPVDWASSFLYIAATVVGTYYCYRCNAAGDGRQFIERFICIGWPVTVRFSVLVVLAFIAVALLTLAVAEDALDAFLEMEILFLVITVVLEVVFYWYFGRQINDTATRRAQPKMSSTGTAETRRL